MRVEPYDPGPPGPGVVRVRLGAGGVNFIDIYHRTGLYPRPLPFVPGLEGAGTVESTGEGVSDVRAGDRVAWAGIGGSYAGVVGSLRSLRPRGMLVAFGQSSGPVPPLNLLRLSELGSLFVTRPTLAGYTQDRAELDLRAGAVLGWVASGRLRVRIGARFPLADAVAAHRALEGRQTTGKVLLLP